MIEEIEQMSQNAQDDLKNSINIQTVQNTEWDHDNEVETSS